MFFCLIIRRPPRSTRTDTLFPYTTLFRSRVQGIAFTCTLALDHCSRLTAMPPVCARAASTRGSSKAPAMPSICRVNSSRFTLDEQSTASRSEEHTSELQSLMRISYAVFCLKKKNKEKDPYTVCNIQD